MFFLFVKLVELLEPLKLFNSLPPSVNRQVSSRQQQYPTQMPQMTQKFSM